jgi:hypothetical protein
MSFTKINKKTAKIFLNNLKQKKYMICYVYFNLKFGDEEWKFLDIAKTQYDDKGNFYINSRGQGYLDYLAFEFKPFKEKKIDLIIKTIHSFLECEEPGL